MVGEIQMAGGRVTCMPATNNLKIILKWRSIIHYIKENNIDLLHCHLPWAGFVGRVVFRFYGIPMLYTEHNKQERYHGVTKWINKKTFAWQTKVIAVSSDVSDSILKNIGHKVPVQNINNGVNTEFFRRDGSGREDSRKMLGIPEGAIVVGIVSVFRFQKRLKEWVDVFSKSLKQCPDLFGVIVGDGPLREEVAAHIRFRNLEKRILLPGLQTDVKPWYHLMDIFMMTSVFEGLPIALLEAMSMECAIITTNAGGIKEVVRNEMDGLVVDVEEWRVLSGQLVRLVNDKGLREILSKAARRRVEESFGMKRMVEELEGVYEGSVSKELAF